MLLLEAATLPSQGFWHHCFLDLAFVDSESDEPDWPRKGRVPSFSVPLRSHIIDKRSFQRWREKGEWFL